MPVRKVDPDSDPKFYVSEPSKVSKEKRLKG